MEIGNMFLEIHGDRAGYDDLAIVTGLGTINGRTYMCIGHQKGRHTKENAMRNFGMPTPHGYRKGEAIAKNLESMFVLKVPIVTVIIGEGGPGGALAIACPNKVLMLENAVFYVARCFYIISLPVNVM
ncbi:Chromatin assembly factor 1 subunit p50 [Orobanche minor]